MSAAQAAAASDRKARIDGPEAWRRLPCSMPFAPVSNASLWVTVALMPALQAEFALTRTAASGPCIVTMARFLIGTPFLGRWSDRNGISRVMIVAGLPAIGGYLAAGLAQSLAVLLAARLVVGIGTSVGFAPPTAHVAHRFVRRRGLAVALVPSSANVPGVLWATIIARILQGGDWREVQSALAAAQLAVLPLALLLRRAIPAGVLGTADRAAAARIARARMSPAAVKWLLVVAGVSCGIAMAMPHVHVVARCIDLGFTLAQGSTLLSVILAAGIVSRIGAGLLMDRIGTVGVLPIGSGLQMLALWLYIPADGLVSLYLVSLVFGLAQGGILPACPMILRDVLPARTAGAVIGTVSMATQFGMAFGGWLSGWIHDRTGSHLIAFANGIGWTAVGIALIVILVGRAAPGRPARPPAARGGLAC